MHHINLAMLRSYKHTHKSQNRGLLETHGVLWERDSEVQSEHCTCYSKTIILFSIKFGLGNAEQ